MQDLVTRSSSGKWEAKSSRQDASSNLLEIAVNMVMKGVTPDVITFVDASNTDINEVVLQEIISVRTEVVLGPLRIHISQM